MSWSTAAPYVAAGVALAVGIIGPWVRNWLAGRRQRDQLAHDRAIRTRDETIALIEDAAKAGSKRFMLTDLAVDRWRAGVPSDDPQAQDLEGKRRVAVEELRDVWGRMGIRFDDDEPVRRRFDEWREQLEVYANIVSADYNTIRPSESTTVPFREARPPVFAQRERAGRAADDFLAAARQEVAAFDAGGGRR